MRCGNSLRIKVRIDQNHTLLLRFEKTSNLRKVFRSRNQKMLVDALSVQVFIEVKFTAVNFTDFSAGGLYNHSRCCHPLKGFIGDDGGISATHGRVTDMSGGTSQ